ncbi:MAG: type VI secretion system baseplate subunit TssE [Alphaproteobacteria bacterium]|nr:type VI secretion system baseplate subunit TssE [Alphaproteobacteria bacterium]
MKKIAVLPIFDRLVDEKIEESFESEAKRYISLEELKLSISEDLTRLLNTKVSPFWVDYAKTMMIPFSYGINSTAPSSAETVFEIQDLESRVRHVIAEFEPRLTNVQVHILSLGVDPGKACLQIDAAVADGDKRIPLSFPIVMETS